MKRIHFSLAAFAAVAMMLVTSVNDPLPIGSAIPKADVKLKDVTGKQQALKELVQKNGLLVMFSCNTCPVVKKYQSRTLEVAKEAATNGIGVALLNSNEASRDDGDGYADMQAYAKEQGYAFSYLLDEKSSMANLFGALRTPEVFLFDGKGLLVYHGGIDNNPDAPSEVTRKHLSLAIQELAAGKEVTMKNTRSVGCVIKRPE